MKNIYNKIIEFVVCLILIIPLLLLLGLKYVLKLVSKIIDVCKAIDKSSISYIRMLYSELIKVLSVSNW